MRSPLRVVLTPWRRTHSALNASFARAITHASNSGLQGPKALITYSQGNDSVRSSTSSAGAYLFPCDTLLCYHHCPVHRDLTKWIFFQTLALSAALLFTGASTSCGGEPDAQAKAAHGKAAKGG